MLKSSLLRIKCKRSTTTLLIIDNECNDKDMKYKSYKRYILQCNILYISFNGIVLNSLYYLTSNFHI